MSLKARETDQVDSTYKRIEINVYIYIYMCVCVHISRVANKMGVNIESQNDGRGSIDRIAFPREDSSVQKRIFVSIRFEFFSLLPPPSPPFLLRLFTEASRIGGLRQYSIV